jgi:hypothetical protein
MEIVTDILIETPLETVWKHLTAFEAYPDWNPFITSIKGQGKQGAQLETVIQPPESKPMTFKPFVLEWKPNQVFRWKGKLFISGLFDGEHYFILEGQADGSTKFIHGEHFSGILVGLFSGLFEKTEKGFRQMNEALKQRCEGSKS